MTLSPRHTLLLLPISLLTTTALASSPQLHDYAIYAGHQVTFSSAINVFQAPLGPVGSSGDISFAPATIRGTSFSAAGSMLNDPSFLTANSLLFNGDVQVNGLSTISGNINAGGNVSIAATVNGTTTASGNISVSGTSGDLFSNSSITLPTFGAVQGNATAAQNISLLQDSSISGSATYGNTLSVGTFSTIRGATLHEPSISTPTSFTPLSITSDTFTSGGSPVSTTFATTTVLTPGSYGALAINSGTLELSPGKYFFDSVSATTSFMTLNLRLDKPGNIEIYVTGDYNIPLQVTDVNGSDISPTTAPLASRVLLESYGNIHIGWNNLGTLFAPSGDISLDALTNQWGSVIAGHDTLFGSAANIQYVPNLIPNTAVPAPEPTTALLLLTTVPLLLRRRK